MTRLAKEAGATIWIGRIVMIDTEILDKYIDSVVRMRLVFDDG